MIGVAERPRTETLTQTTELARHALKSWGAHDCEPLLLKHRENAVFRATLPGGRPCALRVHRLNYHTDAALRSELQWMSHLRESGIETPVPYATQTGDLFALVATEDLPEPRQVDCLSWMDGRPLGESRVPLGLEPAEAKRVFRLLGKTIARMHNVTAGWARPVGFERHAWDFEGFFGARPLWGVFENSPLLPQVLCEKMPVARERAVEALKSYGTSERRLGLIHADPVRENVLVSGDAIQIIDFDDCGFGWHMYDIAVALYQNREETLYEAIEDALLEGYGSERSLSDADVEALPLFTSLRAFALLGWMLTRADNDAARLKGAAISAKAAEVAIRCLGID